MWSFVMVKIWRTWTVTAVQYDDRSSEYVRKYKHLNGIRQWDRVTIAEKTGVMLMRLCRLDNLFPALTATLLFTHTHTHTSNVTAVTEVLSTSARLFAGMWSPLVSVITTLYYVTIICHHRVWYHALSLRAFVKIKVGHHPHPQGYVCAKFCFFHGLHRWAGPQRKIADSITHSPRIFDAPGTEALRNKCARKTFKRTQQQNLWSTA